MADNWDQLWGAPTKPQGTAVQPSQQPEDIVANMPNADKLTPFERGIYKALPGFSESTIGKALAKFGDSWAGKALNFLDVGAEGLERTVGLAKQFADLKPGEELDLKSAWYAGSLTGDMMNLPTFKRDENGKIVGMQIPNDLPGMNGLAQARVKIQRFISEGMSEKEALAKVRDEYYNDLGALALRAQLNDTYFHVIADPFNYIMPGLKPVEALQARRITALTEKVAYSAEELGQLANKATDAANFAKTAGKLDDFAKYSDEANKLTQLAADVASGKVKGMDRFDKFTILLTGGDPLSTPQNKLVDFVTKPFQLTPQSKAQELLNMVNNNISSKIIAQLWDDPDAVNKIADTLTRASKGATGVEFGHAFLTTEGRTVQGFLGGADTIVNKVREDFNALASQRGLLQVLKDTLGENPEKILKLADENPELLMKMLQQKPNPTIANMLARGELNADVLNQTAKMLKGMPYDKETAIVHMMGAIEEQAAKQAIIQFGVEKNKLITRWSNAIKSAESLAFMRINPGYVMRNAINNKVTMAARGVFGLMSETQAKSFWDDIGFLPKRLQDAFDMGADITQASGRGEKVIQEAVAVKGKLEDFKQFVNNLSLGKGNALDMTKYSRMMEAADSRQAMTLGFQQFYQKHWQAPRVENLLDPTTVDALNAVDPGIAQALNSAVKSSYGSKTKLAKLLKENLNLNVQSVLDEAGAKLGIKVEDTLGTELTGYLAQKLPDAIKEGKVEQFIFDMRNKVDAHVDEIFEQNVKDIVDNVSAQVQAGGPQMFYRKVSDAQDAFWGAHIEHAMKSPQQWDAFREAKNSKEWARAASIAERNLADDQKFFGRAFKRVDAYLEGLEKGAKEAGLQMPTEVRRGFKDFQNNWKSFFDFRNAEYKRINGLPWEERKLAFDNLQTQLDAKYKEAVEFEDRVMQQADDAVANMIQDPAQKKLFMSYRDQIAAMQKADKEAVMQMWQQVRNSPVEDRAGIINQFWADRKGRLENIRQTDRAGLAAMQGDTNASAVFGAPPTQPTEGFNIYSLANEYGIPSATEAGARNDRRILNTVNKYLKKQRGETGVPEKLMKKAVEIPRSELPPEVSSEFERIAKELQSELFSGTGPTVQQARQGEGAFSTTRSASTNVDWYKELYKEGMGKKQVDAALEKIVQDAGKDKGKGVERLKELILERISYGDPKTGQPPDLNLLREMNAPEDVMKRALGDFNEITKQDLSLDEALQQLGSNATDFTQDAASYYDEAGNLVVNKYTNVADIPEDVARKAFEASGTAQKVKETPDFILDVKSVVPDIQPIDLGLSELSQRQFSALDAVVDGAKTQAQKTPVILEKLPPDLQKKVMGYIDSLDSEFSSSRLAATKFAEWRRDSALLNYSRRTNFDAAIANIFPYAFWTTNSMMKWAVESIDRPAMLTTYLRMKKLLETAGAQNSGFPSRYKDHIRVDLPFAPEWMGQQFIDPMRLLLPFDAFAQPIEQYQKSQLTIQGRAERTLDTMLQQGQITREEYDQALTHQGAVWDQAVNLTTQNDENLKYDAWDFMNLMSSPHAPLQWAYNAARGRPEDIGSFTPMARTMRQVATALGVEDYVNSNWNVEGKVRKAMGLPAFDKWEDYRVDREISNFAGTGDFTLDEIKEAMAISSLVQQGKMDVETAKENKVYAEAIKRSNLTYTGGKLGAITGLLGIPIKGYADGEANLRALGDDFSMAYEKYKNADQEIDKFIAAHPEMTQEQAMDAFEKANPTLARDAEALTRFFDEHPEYETRLGLWDKPEERLQKFMVDRLWAQWNSLPKLTKDELREQLGNNFNDAFLNKDTRSYDAMSIEEMTMYLNMMGGKGLPGVLTADQKLLETFFSGQLKTTDPETAWRVQVFYDQRKQFGNYYELQKQYYEIQNKAQRKAFLTKNPELKAYWDFRREFLTNNPDLVQYLTDNPEQIAKAQKMQRNPEVAVPTAQEIAANLSPFAQNLLAGYQQGEELPPEFDLYIEEMADSYNLTAQQLLQILQVQ